MRNGTEFPAGCPTVGVAIASAADFEQRKRHVLRNKLAWPTALDVIPAGIPSALKSLPQWAVWSYKYDPKEKKWDKPPYGGASSTDARTWRSFDAAYKLYLELGADGLYVAHSAEHPMTGGDFDDCVCDGTIAPIVETQLRALNTYTEKSPSGSGIRTINWGEKPGSKCRKAIDGAEFELYDRGRWLSITGHHVDGYPDTINDDPDAVTAVYEDIFGESADAPMSYAARDVLNCILSDDLIITKASAAKDGDKFSRLFYDGDTSEYDFDDSRADAGLCSILKFWTQNDFSRIDELFRSSALMRPKWDRKTGDSTYGEITIQKVIELGGDVYQNQGQNGGDDDGEEQVTKKPLSELKFDRNLQHELCVVTEDKVGNEHIKPIPGAIATYLQENYFWFITYRDTEKVLYYDVDSLLYREGGEKAIKAVAETIIGDPLTTHVLEQIIAHIQRQTYVDRDDVDSIANLDLVPVENGILNTVTRVLIDYSHEHYYTHKLPVSYDPKAPTAPINAYMVSTFAPADIPWIQEYYGWHLERSMRFQKGVMLLGDGDNGKTVFINIMLEVIGLENCCSVSVQDTKDDPYSAALMHGMYANFYDDLPSLKLRDTGAFKMTVGNVKKMKARRIYEPPFYFHNYAKGTYSANKPPGTRDISHAFFKRWLIAEMPYTFVDPVDNSGEPTKLSDGQKHKEEFVDVRMTTPEMRSSWLNWMLDGYDRLRKHNCFTSSKTQDDVRELWMRLTAPVTIYAKERIEPALGVTTPKEDVYADYQEWCEDNDIVAEKEAEFAKTFKSVVRTKSTRPRVGKGKRKTAWSDIRFVPGKTKDDEDDDEGSKAKNPPSDSHKQQDLNSGQGGQGENTQPVQFSEKYNIKGVMGYTPDRPDQLSNVDIISTVLSHLEILSNSGITATSYETLVSVVAKDIHMNDYTTTNEDIVDALNQIVDTDDGRELIARCVKKE